ncbi:histidine phosphatase superfamily [Infundibulicybe gibba]|nr:histidine phosphatase superfamily [Infundibulicybe gibba]
MVLTVTFVRHGESEDNLKDIWAGWKDAPLSPLAHAIGKAFSTARLDYIYASPLLRAHETGLAIHSAQPSPKPPISTNPKLREQHFGIAEGWKWVFQRPENATLEELYKRGIFPVLYGRDEKFPEAESLNDLARRAEEALAECVLPHLEESFTKDVHVVIASHGLCISELIVALLRLDPAARRDISYAGTSGPTDPHSPPPLHTEVIAVNNADHFSFLVCAPANHSGTLTDAPPTIRRRARALEHSSAVAGKQPLLPTRRLPPTVPLREARRIFPADCRI